MFLLVLLVLCDLWFYLFVIFCYFMVLGQKDGGGAKKFNLLLI